jgi:hypothetical protein
MDERFTTDPADESGHWFLLDLAIARERARAIAGPPPAEVIGPVAREHALAALEVSLAWHREHEPDSANALVNACRAWYFASENVWASKPEAAAWATDRMRDAVRYSGVT